MTQVGITVSTNYLLQFCLDTSSWEWYPRRTSRFRKGL